MFFLKKVWLHAEGRIKDLHVWIKILGFSKASRQFTEMLPKHVQICLFWSKIVDFTLKTAQKYQPNTSLRCSLHFFFKSRRRAPDKATNLPTPSSVNDLQATAKEIDDAIEEHIPDADDAEALLDFGSGCYFMFWPHPWIVPHKHSLNGTLGKFLGCWSWPPI